ncbi:MAG: penicillin-binding protein activator LpoB [Victivallales bacterium]|jgi:hypothetical protein|nr:penicillin-binding protein activator LpoB [Victivallales bacterium]MBT7298792.1 penicillin-binding protein activator LpoB [Victivallales bacterium]
MRSRILVPSGALALALLFSGCESIPKNIDMQNDNAHAVMALDYRDFQKTADILVQSLLGSGRLKKPNGGACVMTTGKIINDTMQRIDTDQLMAKIEESLMNSGQVVMTSAIAAGDGVDKMVYKVREKRNSDEFNQGTIAEKGQLVAPELSISGKIIQRDVRYERRKTQVEYYFQLKVTGIGTGLRLWQKEEVIGKRGSNKSVSW